MIQSFRQAAITIFCVFHFLSVSWWAFPNSFAQFALQQDKVTGWFYDLEKHFFEWHKEIRGSSIIQVFESYVNLTGAHQYWDFFAPESPRIAHVVTVCLGVQNNSAMSQINCSGNALYNSHDGNLTDVVQPLHGHRSRSYRFVENLVTMDQQWLDQFMNYWLRLLPAEHPDGQIIYLIDDQLTYQSDDLGIPIGYNKSSSILAFDLVETRDD
ncbi:MAG: hypothetical protein K0U68_01665 [Gammaproteobacteria bacterium]|nr:hypothetical protein [Gammaproteobacteria bacterium]